MTSDLVARARELADLLSSPYAWKRNNAQGAIAPLVPLMADEIERLKAERESFEEGCVEAHAYLDETDADERDALRDQLGTARELLAEFVDDEECVYDHHGYCQTHRLGEMPCENTRARAFLAAVPLVLPQTEPQP